MSPIAIGIAGLVVVGIWFAAKAIGEPPNVRTHRKAAEGARAVRDVAATNARIEMQMLQKRVALASAYGRIAERAGNRELAARLAIAWEEGQEYIEKAIRSDQGAKQDYAELMGRPKSAAKYVDLAKFDVEYIGLHNAVEVGAKQRLNDLGVICSEAAELYGNNIS